MILKGEDLPYPQLLIVTNIQHSLPGPILIIDFALLNPSLLALS